MTLNANDEARSTIDVVTEFLTALFGETENPIFFQTLANDAGDADEAPNKKSILTRDVAAIEKFIARFDRSRRGLFFCVSTIALGSSTRNKENSRELVVVHTDLDFRSILEDEPTIRRVADTLLCPPSSVVFSGGGLHLYWLLKEPLHAQDNRDRLEALNRKIAIILAGDGAATDCCRLMRLPGSTNSKYESQRKVAVEKLDAAFRYDLEDLEEWVADARPLLTPRPAKEKTRRKKRVSSIARVMAKTLPETGGVSAIQQITGGKGMIAEDNSGSNHTLQEQDDNHPENPYLTVAEEQGWKPPLDVEQALADMTYPGNVHDTQIRVAASLLKAGHDVEHVVATILVATVTAVGPAGQNWDWRAEEKAIRASCAGAYAKFDIPPGNAPDLENQTTNRDQSGNPVNMTGKGSGIGYDQAAVGGGNSDEIKNVGAVGAETAETENADVQDGQSADGLHRLPIGSSVPSDGSATSTVIPFKSVKGAGQNRAKLGTPKHAQNAQTPNATHIVLARTVMTVLEREGHRLKFTDKGCWHYWDGLWGQLDDKALRGWLDAALEQGAQGMGLESTSRLINEARTYIIRQPTLQGREVTFDGHGQVPTSSGLICPIKGTIRPTTPEDYCTWRVPFHYEPLSFCPNWLTMMDDAFADRPEPVRDELKLFLQEVVGMGLIDGPKAKALCRALILVGGSNAGKSDLIDVMSGVFGPSSIAVDITSLEGPHGMMPFTQRLPWVLHEAFDQSKWHLSAIVKALISGEPVQINIKNGPIYSRRISVPIFWGTNNPPQFKEATAAIVNRIAIVECKRKFDEDHPVGAGLAARQAGYEKPSELVLATEMEGVLAWAVDGLLRAKARGYFLIPGESRAAAEAVRKDSNIVAGFLDDAVTFDPDSMVSVPDFSAALASWWAEHKGSDRGVPSSESVGRAIRALAEPRIAADPKLRDEHRRYYAGVQLTVEGKRHWKNAVTSEAYLFQSRRASTSGPEADPNRAIPGSWWGRAPIEAMRLAQAKPMTVLDDGSFPGDRPWNDTSKLSGEPSGKPSGVVSSKQVPEPPEDIPF